VVITYAWISCDEHDISVARKMVNEGREVAEAESNIYETKKKKR
jgi:hypothetical protein